MFPIQVHTVFNSELCSTLLCPESLTRNDSICLGWAKKLLQVLLAPGGYGMWEILYIVCYCKRSHGVKVRCSVHTVLGTVSEVLFVLVWLKSWEVPQWE